jgi:kynurenine formamidase
MRGTSTAALTAVLAAWRRRIPWPGAFRATLGVGSPHEDEAAAVERSRALVPAPPWPAGDERGMANALGNGTWLRCAHHLSDPRARLYELSHERSNTMPRSPFSVPLETRYRPTAGLPGTRHAFSGDEIVTGEPGQQGTHMDALGHFAYLDEPWDGAGAFPAERVRYYGGFTQEEVKPTPDSPLLRLGIDKAPPIVTSAVLLDARAFLGGGQAMRPGQLITAGDIEAMIGAQDLAWRGLLPGDVLYVYTGWGENWRDPDVEKVYYTMGPGLSYDAARYLEEKRVVLVALDNPFTDPANEGQLRGEAPAPEGTPPDLPFVVHHHALTQAGIHLIQNANLAELARDRVWTSGTIILPLRERGGTGSPVRPVAIGAPQRR